MTPDILSAADALAQETQNLARTSQDPQARALWAWQSPQCLVAPRNLAVLPGYDEAAQHMAWRGWPVFIRATGGDVVPQGPGIVNVSHVYARAGGPVNIAAEYDALCAPVVAALGPGASVGWQAGAFCDGAYNVQYQDRKFAGTAMRFRPCKGAPGQYAILAHALLLMAPPPQDAIDALNAFLAMLNQPRRIMAEAHCGLPDGVAPADFLRRLEAAFLAALQ